MPNGSLQLETSKQFVSFIFKISVIFLWIRRARIAYLMGKETFFSVCLNFVGLS